jgi:hypothetical protein
MIRIQSPEMCNTCRQASTLRYPKKLKPVSKPKPQN